MAVEASLERSVSGGTVLHHPLVARVFAAFERESLRWCLLRQPAESDQVDEVDLLLDGGDEALARELVRGLGFVHVPAWGHGSHRFFVAYDASSDDWIKLDIVTDLAFGPYQALRTGLAVSCLARRELHDGIQSLAADDAFWTLLLHCILDKGAVPDHHAARLHALALSARTDGEWTEWLGRGAPAGSGTEWMVARARAGDWAALAGLRVSLLRGCMQEQPIGGVSRVIGNRSLRKLRRFGLPRRVGVSVALLAPDGAGKSAGAAALQASFFFPAVVVYMGLYRGGRFLWRGTAVLRLVRQRVRYLRGQWHKRLGRLVIFDRYSYDALLPSPGRLTRRGRLRRWLLARACPAPDLVIVLDAPGDVLYLRKGEHGVPALEAQRQRYLALQQRLPRSVVVDAAQDRDGVHRDLTAAIWQAYMLRAST